MFCVLICNKLSMHTAFSCRDILAGIKFHVPTNGKTLTDHFTPYFHNSLNI